MNKLFEKIVDKIKGRETITERLPLDRNNVSAETGLTEEQVSERISKGYVNSVKIGTSKSVWNIIRTNVFTFFNLLLLGVFVWMLVTIFMSGQWGKITNCMFFLLVVINTMIGIVQELLAKRTMDKLSLLSSPDVTVRRNGEDITIKLNEILLDDILVLAPGKQICSDAAVTEGSIEVNESMLTGESLPIKKEKGDTVLSGSFVVSGRASAQVSAIGDENYIQRLAAEAKQFKSVPSQLIKSLKLIMRVIAVFVVPMGILTFLNSFSSALNEISLTSDALFGALGHVSEYASGDVMSAYYKAVFSTSTAVVGMIPAGMFLLTSVALAVGIRRLAKKRANVQELYSIETLARVDTLCLDKTGTITDGTMSVKEVITLGRKFNGQKVGEIISSMQYALDENNSTAVALQEKFGKNQIMVADYTIPFSSERKTSAIKSGDNLFIIGAPEYVTNQLTGKQQEILDGLIAEGLRCLLLAAAPTGKSVSTEKLPKNGSPVAIIVIEDNIKPDTVETIAYFKGNGVDVRVISGDNPAAVAAIAQKVGIENADKYVSLMDKTDDEVIELAKNHTVFGRVSPAQKKLLVQVLKGEGRTVAMTGDGINDILAMKEADCSIAMAAGSEATRNVANLVLMDSNFGSMPSIVAEGRRVINNIQRSSSLFLIKTVFSFMLSLLLVFIGKEFPIQNIQLTFISMFAIGLPSFVLALQPNNNRIKGNFISNVLKKVIPSAVAIVFAVMMIMTLDEHNELFLSGAELSTMVMITIFAIYYLILVNICKPFNPVRKALLAFIAVCTSVIVFFSPMLPDQRFNIFEVASLKDIKVISIIIALVTLSYLILTFGNFVIKKYIDKIPPKNFEKSAAEE